MKHLLATAQHDLLAQFAWSNVLLAFDFDGTLAPIVADRGEARMRPRTRALLCEACDAYPVAVISGRSRADVRARLGGAKVRYVVGNHGLESTARMKRWGGFVDAVRPDLERALAGVPGVDVEDKRYSLAVHYRRSRRKRAAREAALRAVRGLGVPVRVVAGKRVINVLPAGAPHKGIALQELRARAGADTAIYVGDDVTDEDVFELDEPGRLLTVRVGESRSSAAAYYVRRQADVDTLLAELVRLRRHTRAPWRTA